MREPGLRLPTDLLIWELAQPSVTGGLATRGGGLDPLQLRPHSPPDARQPLGHTDVTRPLFRETGDSNSELACGHGVAPGPLLL